MSKQLEPEDLIARLGGDEFAILLRGGRSHAEAEELAARLIDVVGRPYLVQGHSVQVGASVGIAFAPADGARRKRSSAMRTLPSSRPSLREAAC